MDKLVTVITELLSLRSNLSPVYEGNPTLPNHVIIHHRFLASDQID